MTTTRIPAANLPAFLARYALRYHSEKGAAVTYRTRSARVTVRPIAGASEYHVSIKGRLDVC